MGGSQSKKEKKIEEKARRNFNIRLNSYNYSYHGPYIQYIDWCRAQYELECMSQSYRQSDVWTGPIWSDYT